MPPKIEYRKGADDIIEFMLEVGGPITRERYLAIAYPQGSPEEFGYELEAQLPEYLDEIAKADHTQPSFGTLANMFKRFPDLTMEEINEMCFLIGSEFRLLPEKQPDD